MAGKDLIELLQGLLGESCDFAAFRYEHISCQYAGPPCVRYHRQLRTFGAGLFAQNLGHIEEVRDRLDPQNPDSAEGGIEYSIVAGKGAGMRRHCFARSLRTPRFDQDNRLSECDFPRRGEKRSRNSDRFHVNQNTLRVQVISQIVDEVSPTDIQHRTDREKGTEPYVLSKTAVQYRGTECATLANECDVSAESHPFEGGRV